MSSLNLIKRFLFEEDGPTATEYAIMLALIILVAFVSLTSLGTSVRDTFGTLTDHFDLG